MSLNALSKRLAKIEGRRGGDRIAGLCNLAGHPAQRAAEAVRDWRAWVDAGKASRIGSTLVLLAPRMTVAEWSARHAPHTGSMH